MIFKKLSVSRRCFRNNFTKIDPRQNPREIVLAKIELKISLFWILTLEGSTCDQLIRKSTDSIGTQGGSKAHKSNLDVFARKGRIEHATWIARCALENLAFWTAESKTIHNIRFWSKSMIFWVTRHLRKRKLAQRNTCNFTEMSILILNFSELKKK